MFMKMLKVRFATAKNIIVKSLVPISISSQGSYINTVLLSEKNRKQKLFRFFEQGRIAMGFRFLLGALWPGLILT